MATTLTYADYTKMIAPHVNKTVTELFGPQVANMAIRKIWSQYNWRVYTQDFRPFYLIPMEQDYGPPFNIVPPDFEAFINADLVRMSSNGTTLRTQLQIKNFLEATSRRGWPDAISFLPGRPSRGTDTGQSGQFRIHPRTPEGVGAPLHFIEGRYKRRPSRLDNSSMELVVPFDDAYQPQVFDVFLWAGKKLGGSQDAGQTVYQNGMAQYSGQLAIAMNAIDEMATIEGFSNGDGTIAPSEPLDSWRGGYYGNF